jgi:hypothetical protein
MIEIYYKGKGILIIVWACFSGRLGRSELYIMERDPELKRGGNSAKSYLKLLDEIIPIV